MDPDVSEELDRFLATIRIHYGNSYAEKLIRLVHVEKQKYQYEDDYPTVEPFSGSMSDFSNDTADNNACEADDVYITVNLDHHPAEILASIKQPPEFGSLSTRRLAQQLTLVDSALFRSIEPNEFVHFLAGGSPISRYSNLKDFIKRFNEIALWTATMVCGSEQVKTRSKVMTKMIRLAHRCFEYRNFNTCMAIVSGLNMSCVSRLKHTLSGVSGRCLNILKGLEARFDFGNNYRQYRDIEKASHAPMVPFFGLVMKDLSCLVKNTYEFCIVCF
jgi:RasGEF domain